MDPQRSVALDPTGIPRLRELIRRGWHKRCPRCGEGPLFDGVRIRDRCPVCDLLYQRDYGDLWMFMIITDRVPMLFGIAALYFGFRATDWLTTLGFFIAMAIPVFGTLRRRQGVALALDYWSRIRFPDPSDELHGGPRLVRAGRS